MIRGVHLYGASMSKRLLQVFIELVPLPAEWTPQKISANKNLYPLHFRAESFITPHSLSTPPASPLSPPSPLPLGVETLANQLDGLGGGYGCGSGGCGGGAVAGLRGVGVQRGGRRAVRAAARAQGPPGRAPELGPHPRQPLHLVPRHLQPRQPRHPRVSSTALSLPPWLIFGSALECACKL